MLISALALFLATSVMPEDALSLVSGWVRAGGALRTHLGTPVSANAHTNASGRGYFAVRTHRGTVFTGSDDGDEPVFAFTRQHLDAIPEDSPLAALLARRMTVPRSAWHAAKWRRLRQFAAAPSPLTAASQGASASSLDDMRVAPLLASAWSQGRAGGRYVYNHDTPNHCACGCVATAMAQVMFYHRWPKSVAALTHPCVCSGVTNDYSIAAGDYDWDNMPAKPAYGITEEQARAIGKLCYDAGVSVYMTWTPSVSGTYTQYVQNQFNNVFGYAAATFFWNASGVDATMLSRAVFSNLDAGYPVMFGIQGSSGGHEIVCDGYGYVDSTPYVHLNMGWAGQDDLWYHAPDFNTSGYSFNTLDSVVYNIIPGTTADMACLSGRVTDGNGMGVPNVSVDILEVKATSSGRFGSETRTTNRVATVRSNAYGVFGAAITPKSSSGSWRNTVSYSYLARVDETLGYSAGASDSVTPGAPTVVSVSVTDECGNPLKETPVRIVASGSSFGRYSFSSCSSASYAGNAAGNDIAVTDRPTDLSIIVTDTQGDPCAIPADFFITNGLVTASSRESDCVTVATNLAANGINSILDCYVAGISPTNENAVFTCEIDMSGETPVLTPHPNLGAARRYEWEYSPDLKTWSTSYGAADRFFRVRVSLP